jgi:acetoacetyl-CoA synthetase
MRDSNLSHYLRFLTARGGRRFDDYSALWQWSVEHLDDFWQSIWEYFDVQADGRASAVLDSLAMPGARWFEGTRLNYAEHVFRSASHRPALCYVAENTGPREMSWAELKLATASVAAYLRASGVQEGDRVVGYLSNTPHAVIAFLACASLGAIWSSCSPDFGTRSVVDRFKQIEPKVLFATSGYTYNGRFFDRSEAVAELRRNLPTLAATVLVEPASQERSGRLADLPTWDDVAQSGGGKLEFNRVPFGSPLWVLYSSGTTGLPKAIVHGHGGVLLEQYKFLALQSDVKASDTFLWYTTTGWVMWNILVGGLLTGAEIVLYDGSPSYPDIGGLWRQAAATGTSFLGASAGYITASQRSDFVPSTLNLDSLRTLGSTGSPLPAEAFRWVYARVKQDLWLASVSGGTDICSGFVGGSPMLPVRVGEIQCRCLGASVFAFDEAGRPVVDQVGELVVTRPMPSMPLFLWNDTGARRYQQSYFEMYPGYWRHGDWIRITPAGSAIIYGRSDSTINRRGVRMGTSEIYRALEDVSEIVDALAIDLEGIGGASTMFVFVVLKPGVEMTSSVEARAKEAIRHNLSPRHVPDAVVAVPDLPRTINGKKLEVPVKRILQGQPVADAVNVDSMANPEALQFFVDFAAQRAGHVHA